jgi:large subunit ribosomal protein L21
MYAIVKTGGKQYRVQTGQRLLIERLAAEAGAEVALEPILYRDKETVLDPAGLEKVKVTAKVIEHVRGEKLRVFKFKPKRGYKRRTGHRQALTRIEVSEISTQKKEGTAKAPASESAKAAPAKPKAPAPAKRKATSPAKPKAPGQAKPKASAQAKPKAPARGKAKAAEQAEGKEAPKAKAKRAAPAKKDEEGSDGA